MDWSVLWDALMALIPPTLVGVIFYVIMRSILRADSTERKVYSEIEAEMRAAQAPAKPKKRANAVGEQRTKSTK